MRCAFGHETSSAHYSQTAPGGNAVMSGDDVGRQPVLDQGNQIFQPQLALFQPLNGQLIRGGRGGKRADCLIQIAVLAAEHLKLHAQYFVRFHRQIAGRIHNRMIPLGP